MENRFSSYKGFGVLVKSKGWSKFYDDAILKQDLQMKLGNSILIYSHVPYTYDQWKILQVQYIIKQFPQS